MQSKQAFPLFIALVSLITFSLRVSAQTDTSATPKDSIGEFIVDPNPEILTPYEEEDDENFPSDTDDSLKQKRDSLEKADSTRRSLNLSDEAIESKVTYTARDTIKYNFAEQKIFLYGDAVVTYEDIELKAEYIELKMDSDIVFARGVKDSTGKVIGSPVFKEGDQEYRSQKMTYNFQTEKGKIDEVITQDGEGYVHGEDVKKTGDDVIYIQNGLYTTCEHDDPHYSIWAKQLKIIPNDKIIVKPANLIIEDVNTPVIVPFGIFPNRKRGKSGVLIPMPGESEQQGFYLFNAGYYFYLGEKAEFQIEGDIYSKGSYAIRPTFRYKKRYRYKGDVNMRHKNTVTGVIPEDPNYSVEKDYWIQWNHIQDPAARPNSYFSAKVDLGSKTSYRNDLNTPDQDYLRTNFSSQISYKKNFFQRKVITTMTARQNQNNSSGNMTITLPEANVSLQRLYPFKSKRGGGDKWYEKVGISYNGNFKNELLLNTDSIAFSRENLDTIQKTFRNGVSHTIPLSVNFKLLKNLTLTPSVNYREIWYFETLEKNMDPFDTLNTVNEILTPGFDRAYGVSTSAGLTTKIYGMMQFRKGYVRAFRHVLTPSVGVTYRPENNQGVTSYTDYSGTEEKQVTYSKYDRGIYGKTSGAESGKLNMSLLNSVEMKVRTKTDTGDGTKKIKLLENLKFSGAYDWIKDSLKFDNVSISGNSRVSKHVDLVLGSTLDLYALRDSATSTSQRINTFEWNKNSRLARMTNGNIGLNFRLQGGKGKSKDNKKKDENNDFDDVDDMDEYNTDEQSSIRKENPQVNWDVPWSLRIQFSLQYRQAIEEYKIKELIQTTTTAGGDLSLTKNWKITYNVMFDTKELNISYATLGITRNLHCWEMTMSWTPIGPRQSYEFHIGVKASLLSDLKMDKRSF